jgi:hypothetical protein
MDGALMLKEALNQETITFIIVGITALVVLVGFYRSMLAQPLSAFLLKRGNIKWAMKVRSQSKGTGCDNCGPSGKSCH